MTVTTRVGDALAVLPALEAGSVQCCVTSPPYYGLRNYGMARQIGLEPTPDAYVANLVAVFREVRRVLADDGTLWLNLGDCYTDGGRGADTGSTLLGSGRSQSESRKANNRKGARPFGLGLKQLLMMPARVAIALQADGWMLRSDIIWAKPNGMPESVTDRPTRAHEYVFLLTKSARYSYDADAVRTPLAASSVARLTQPTLDQQQGSTRANGGGKTNGAMKAVVFGGTKYAGNERADGKENAGHLGATRNRARESEGVAESEAGANLRDVWWIPTEPNRESHFAMMPRALATRCILAGSAPGDTVLDPFAGAGTTGLVADRLGRNAVLIELNPDYAALAQSRIAADAPLLCGIDHG